MRLLFSLLFAGVAFAQSNLITPVHVLPKADHSATGVFTIRNTANTADLHTFDGSGILLDATGQFKVSTHSAVTSGNVIVDNCVRFAVLGAGVSGNYVGFCAPATIAANTTWTLPNTDGSANDVLTTNGAGVLSWTAGGGGGSSPPFIDTTEIIKGSVTATKRLRFEVDTITAATTRTWTAQDKNLTVAGIDVTQTFTADQTFSANILAGTADTYAIGSGAVPFAIIRSNEVAVISPIIHAAFTLKSNAFLGNNRFQVTDPVGTVIQEFQYVSTFPRWTFQADLFPETTLTRSLGSTSVRWATLYGQSLDMSGYAGNGDQCLYANNSGQVNMTLIAGFTGQCVTSASTQTITGLKTFANSIAFGSDAIYSIGTAGVRVNTIESQLFVARTAPSGARKCQVSGAAVTCTDGAGTTMFSVTSLSGQMTSAALSGSGNRCLDADASGNMLAVSGGDCIVAALSPLTNVLGTVSCSTCVTTARTISTSAPLTGGGALSANLTLACGNCDDITTTQTISGQKTFSNTNNQLTGSLFVTGNLYLRALGSNAIGCSGIADGWFAANVAGQELLLCAGGNRYKVALIAY